MWSIPTRRKPIPKFTASVYFTYVVSKIKPKVITFRIFLKKNFVYYFKRFICLKC